MEKYEDQEFEYKACRNLAGAVILTAFSDALKPIQSRNSKVKIDDEYDERLMGKNKTDAILFLTGNGDFKKAREMWGTIADINPEFFPKAFLFFKNNPEIAKKTILSLSTRSKHYRLRSIIQKASRLQKSY